MLNSDLKNLSQSKQENGWKLKYNDKGEVIGEVLYRNGKIVREIPSEWRLSSFSLRTVSFRNWGSLTKKGTIYDETFTRVIDIVNGDEIIQHGYRQAIYDKKTKKLIAASEIIPEENRGFPDETIFVSPYTQELKELAKKQRGRGLYSFSENAPVCILPSAKFYKKPGIMQYLDKTHRK